MVANAKKVLLPLCPNSFTPSITTRPLSSSFSPILTAYQQPTSLSAQLGAVKPAHITALRLWMCPRACMYGIRKVWQSFVIILSPRPAATCWVACDSSVHLSQLLRGRDVYVSVENGQGLRAISVSDDMAFFFSSDPAAEGVINSFVLFNKLWSLRML